MFLSRLTRKRPVRNARGYFARAGRRLLQYRFFAYLAILGPGIIAANSGNDASGIATYSSAGAQYGYTLLWIFIPTTISLIIVQEMCMRMGAVTGQGLADLIREQFGVRWAAFVMLALTIANTGVIISEFVGIAAASELLGIPRAFALPAAAGFIWWLVIKGSRARVERVFLLMSLVLLSYVFSVFFADTDWRAAAEGVLKPSLSGDSGYLFIVIALIGTTITPFMQVYVQSSVVDKGIGPDEIGVERFDVIGGTFFACAVAAVIMIASAATLHSAGIYEVDSALTASIALSPVAGEYAVYVFAIGVFGASMVAMGVLPLSTAYSLSEALGFEKGVSRTFREAPVFLGIFTALILIGCVIAMIPWIPQIKLLLFTQCVNGLLLPIILGAILKLSGSEEIMGEHRNPRWLAIVGWTIATVISLISFMLIGQTIADMF